MGQQPSKSSDTKTALIVLLVDVQIFSLVVERERERRTMCAKYNIFVVVGSR